MYSKRRNRSELISATSIVKKAGNNIINSSTVESKVSIKNTPSKLNSSMKGRFLAKETSERPGVIF